MQSYLEFTGKQLSKYKAIGDAGLKVTETGLRHDPSLAARQGCASIALRHRPWVASKAEEVSRQIAKVVPAVVYTAQDIHTTLCSAETTPHFYPRERSILRQELESLAKGVLEVIGSVWPGSIKIDFTSYLFNNSVTMAAGMPNEEYVVLVGRLVEALAPMRVYPTNDAHITMSRFKSGATAQQLEDFLGLGLMDRQLGESLPDTICVGYSNWDPMDPDASNGHFMPYHSFKFSEL